MQNDELLTLKRHGEKTRLQVRLFPLVRFLSLTAGVYFCSIFFSVRVMAQNNLPAASELKKLSFEELMNIEVTSVSKVPEKLSEVASAIQVVTYDDVHRSASNTLPEALRLASNLQVAKPNSHDWAISSRGFNAAPLANNTLSNKLLVLVDGRSVYTPLFGGVFWDVQNVLMEDLDRIEVVSGPGGTLWGANAVNGVINIMTKSARETQGLYVSSSNGTFLHEHLEARYGERLDSNLYLRVYGQQYQQGSVKLRDGTDARDGWTLTQAGFRMDYYQSPKNTFSLHGDIYGGQEEDPIASQSNGQNLTGKWVHTYSPTSELVVQAYFDRTWKFLPKQNFRDLLNTYDVELQHRFQLNKSNSVLWGVGYRLMDDNVNNSPAISFIPADKNLNMVNTFIQDQISIIPKKLELTAGTKLLYNDYSKFEWQPSARVSWTPFQKHTIWAAVSRAVRTPSRFETDEITTTLSTPNHNFVSETVVAYELGYRVQLVEKASLSFATFYNEYDNLRSVNRNPNPPTTYIFANDQQATTWGIELSANIVATEWWRLRSGYTYLNKNFTAKSPLALPTADIIEALDPKHQVMFQSVINLSKHFQFDMTGRYVDGIKSTLPVTISVSSYTTFDARLAWENRRVSVTLMGQNLATRDHIEFGTRQIPRTISAKISLRL